MTTAKCEVIVSHEWNAEHDCLGDEILCGAPATLTTEGFPMCRKCAEEYATQDVLSAAGRAALAKEPG